MKKILGLLMMAVLCVTVSCGDNTKDSQYNDLTLGDRYTAPERVGKFVNTVYKYQLKTLDTAEWADVLMIGFAYTGNTATDDEFLSVTINYVNNTLKIYYVAKSDYVAFRNKRISAEAFMSKVKVREN